MKEGAVMKKLTVFVILFSMLFTCGCGMRETQGKTVDYRYRDELVLSIEEIPDGIESESVSIPEFVYEVSVFDREGRAVSETSPLKLKGGCGEMRVEIEHDSNLPTVFGVMLISAYLPIEFTAENKKTFCYEAECEPGEKISLSIAFDTYSSKEYSSLKLVVVEKADIVARSVLSERDYSVAIDIPFDGKSGSYGEGEYHSGDENVKYIYDAFTGMRKVVGDYLLRQKNNSLFTAPQSDDEISFSAMDHFYSTPNTVGSGYFRAVGQAGKYATIIYVDNQPCRAFDGKYTLVWELNTPEDLLDTVMTLPGYGEGVHKIYSLTFPIDGDIEKQSVYSSPIRPYIISENTDTSGGDWNEFKVSIAGEGEEYTDFYDLQGKITDYTEEKIKLRLSHCVRRSLIQLEYSIFVLCNGVVQEIEHGGGKGDRIEYSMSHGKQFDTDISFTPRVLFDTDILNIDVIFLPELTNVYNHEMIWNLNVLGITQRTVLNYSGKVSVTDEGTGDYSETASVSKAYPPRVFSCGEIRKNDMNIICGAASVEYELISGCGGRYVVLAFLDGELLPVADGKNYACFRDIMGESRKTVIQIPESEETERKLLILTVPLDTVYEGARYYAGVYFNQENFIKKEMAENSIGTLTAYGYQADGMAYGYADFECTESGSGYFCSYVVGSGVYSGIPSLSYTNSCSFDNSKFCIDKVETVLDSLSGYVTDGINTRIYLKTDNGCRVAKYVAYLKKQ